MTGYLGWRPLAGGVGQMARELCSGRLGVGQALPLPQGDRALSRLGPQQCHLTGGRKQHMDRALVEVGVDEQFEAVWMN